MAYPDKQPKCYGESYDSGDSECTAKCILSDECFKETQKTLYNDFGSRSSYGYGYGSSFRGRSLYGQTQARSLEHYESRPEKNPIIDEKDQVGVSLFSKVMHNSLIGGMESVIDEAYGIIRRTVKRIKKY